MLSVGELWHYQFSFGVEDMVWWLVAGLVLIFFVLSLERLIRAPYVSDIYEKHVVITGCDTGFGHAAALRLGSLGCTVFAACLTDIGQQQLDNKADRDGCRVITLQMDVTDDDSIERAAKEVQNMLPKDKGLWGLVNNAGILGSVGPMQWQSRHDMLKTFDVNVFGLVSVTRAFLPLLQRRHGRLVNTSSVVSHAVLPFIAPYCMSKHAVDAMGNAMRTELRPFGVSVHLIEPGIHRTPFMDPTALSNTVRSLYTKQPRNIQEMYGDEYRSHILFLGTELIPLLGSGSTDNVVAAYEHALFSALPKKRYPVGLDSLPFLFLSYLPSWIPDLLYQLPLLKNVPAINKKKLN